MFLKDLEEAEKVFFRLASGDYDEPVPPLDDLLISNWCQLNIYLPEPSVSSSMPPAYMEALLEIQKQIYQLAALCRTGLANTVYLNEDDKRLFDITVVVTGGSSFIKVDLDQSLKNALKEAITKMTGKQLVIVVLGLGILFSSTWGYSAYLEQQKEINLAEIKSLEHQSALKSLNFASEKQIEMLDRVLSIVSRNGPEGEKAQSVVKHGYDALLKANSRTSKSVINERVITQEEARILRVTPRQKAEPEIAKMQIRVLDINTDDPINIQVVIRDLQDDGEYRIKLPDSLFAKDDRNKLFEALRFRSELWTEVAIKKVDEEIKSVELLRVIDSF